MKTWHIILTGSHDGPTNMAIDEALLLLADKGIIPPTLRFFGWTPATLSLGYFQKAEQVVNLPECQKRGVGVVRRMTGGGALLHDQEVTYSFIWPHGEEAIPANIRGSYYEILTAFKRGLAESLGVETQLARDAKTQGREAFCLTRETCYDLLVEGKKLVGSAQRRLEGAALQHGSVLLDLDTEKLAACFKPGGVNAEEIEQKVTTLARVLKTKPSFDGTVAELVKGWESHFNVKLQERKLANHERGLVERLRQEKYTRLDWKASEALFKV